MATLTEGRRPGEFIMTEANGQRSREAVTVGASQTIEPGGLIALLAQAADVTVDTAAASGNTGNGTIAMASPAISGKAKNGVYNVIFTAATAFKVEDPNGVEIGIGSTGNAFNKEVKFTITAGGTAHVAGDSFTITVGVESPGDYQAVEYDPSATDGSEVPAGVAIYGATTGAGETVGVAAIVRDAEINGHCVAWPQGISAKQQAAAVAALGDVGIIVRF